MAKAEMEVILSEKWYIKYVFFFIGLFASFRLRKLAEIFNGLHYGTLYIDGKISQKYYINIKDCKFDTTEKNIK